MAQVLKSLEYDVSYALNPWRRTMRGHVENARIRMLEAEPGI